MCAVLPVYLTAAFRYKAAAILSPSLLFAQIPPNDFPTDGILWEKNKDGIVYLKTQQKSCHMKTQFQKI